MALRGSEALMLASVSPSPALGTHYHCVAPVETHPGKLCLSGRGSRGAPSS